MKSINVAILGFGTVGRGTFKVLLENEKLIEARCGFKVNVKKILDINPYAIKSSGLPKRMFTSNIKDILDDPSIQIVAEVMGGIEPASTYMLKALNAKKHVVSSNKAALAENISQLKEAAKKNKVELMYEASVCGAIPVLSAIKGNLAANKFTEIRGIVNGTSNYILTQMTENGMRYEAALALAQEHGFAEADPTADVEGIDAANKICLLADLAMGYYRKPSAIKRVGISGITDQDIKDAVEKDCKIKLIAKAKLGKNGIVLSVKPELIKKDDILYNVDYEFNGITLKTDCADDVFFYGRGAGSVPTGSAVSGDIISIAKIINAKPAEKSPAKKK